MPHNNQGIVTLGNFVLSKIGVVIDHHDLVLSDLLEQLLRRSSDVYCVSMLIDVSSISTTKLG